MNDFSIIDDFNKINSDFLKEHNRLISKHHVDFISLKSVKLPLITLYNIISLLFENNSIKLKKSDVILLTLSAIGVLGKENKEIVFNLIEETKKYKIYNHFELVKNTVKSFKNLVNIIFKKEGAVITNIEQCFKYKHAIDVFNYALTFIRLDGINIKDFNGWYISDIRSKHSRELIDYINLNYYLF